MVLERELSAFNARRSERVAAGHTGQWVAMHGEELLGFYPGMDSAYQAGLEAWGNAVFLIKQVRARDEIGIIHRSIRVPGERARA